MQNVASNACAKQLLWIRPIIIHLPWTLQEPISWRHLPDSTFRHRSSVSWAVRRPIRRANCQRKSRTRRNSDKRSNRGRRPQICERKPTNWLESVSRNQLKSFQWDGNLMFSRLLRKSWQFYLTLLRGPKMSASVTDPRNESARSSETKFLSLSIWLLALMNDAELAKL